MNNGQVFFAVLLSTALDDFTVKGYNGTGSWRISLIASNIACRKAPNSCIVPGVNVLRILSSSRYRGDLASLPLIPLTFASKISYTACMAALSLGLWKLTFSALSSVSLASKPRANATGDNVNLRDGDVERLVVGIKG